MRKICTFFPLLFLAVHIFAQVPTPDCGTDELLKQLLSNDPSTLQRHLQIEQSIYNHALRGSRGGGGNTYVLPVVVHIIHNNGPENISDAQAIQAVTYLNQSFANIGYYDSLSGVNTGIQFCLAKQNPQGASTTGIDRVQSVLTDLDMDNQDIALKNLSRWNPYCYINIWVVKDICSSSMGTCAVAGYAYFPSAHGRAMDGIVVEASYFGTSPSNTTVTSHEMGHYLGLYHTFQGGCTNNNCLTDGDKVCDTPPDNSTARIACSGTMNSCTTDVLSGFTTDQPDLHHDYMDYTPVTCRTIFTAGQRDRMQWHIDNVRHSLLNCPSCNNPCLNPVTAQFSPSTSNALAGSTVTFTNQSTGASIYTWYLNGSQFSSVTSPAYTFGTVGTYIVRLKAEGTDTNCVDYFNDTITVTCGAQASFTQPTTQIGTGQSVTFTNTSTGATSYQWYLDGVLQTTATNFSNIFNQQGTFAVYLIASNGICSDTTSIVNFIHVGPPCNISYTYSQTNPSTYLILQPDAAAGKDAHIFSVVPGSSNGISPDFLAAQWTWQGVPGEVKPLLQFDLSGIPTGSIIHSATLSLYANSTSNSGYPGQPTYGNNNACYLNRITSPWVEATVSWNTAPSVTTIDQVLLPQAVNTNQDYPNIDITNFAQYWYQNPSQNFGMMLDMIGTSYYNSLIFCSSDHADSIKRPKLAIYYTPPANTCFPVYFIPDTTCKYSNYLWTFCEPDFLDSISVTLHNNGSFGNNPCGPVLMKDNSGNYFAFYTNYNATSSPYVYRVAFGNSITNTPVYTSISTPAISFVNAAHSIDIFYDGGSYYGFVLFASRIYRLSFGSSITNTSPTVTQLTGINTSIVQWGHKIQIVRESNNFWLIVASRTTGTLTLLFLGNSITNNVQTELDYSCPTCAGFSYHRINGNHYVYATSLYSGVKRFSFGNSLSNTPVQSAFQFFGSALHCDIALYQNCDGSLDGILAKENSPADHIVVHLDSGNANFELVRYLGGSLARAANISRFVRTDEGITALVGNGTANGLGHISLADCGQAYSTQQFPPPVYYSNPGTYYVRLTVDEGLPSQQVYCNSITIDSTNKRINLGNDITSCVSQAVTLHAGPGYISYLWQDGSTDSTFTAYAAGTYWVEVLDDCNRTYRDTIVITVDSATAINLRDTTFCQPTTIPLIAPAGFQRYLWTPSNTVVCDTCRITTANPLTTTTYTVTCRTGESCVNAGSMTAYIFGSTVSISSTNTGCGVSNGSARVNLITGTGPYTYLWSNGGTNDSISNLAAGTYSVVVTDAGGCSATASAVVNASNMVPPVISSDKAIMCADDTARVCVNTSYTSYLWNTGQTGQCINVTQAGNYYVSVTDAANCTAASNHLPINIYPQPPVSISVNGDTLTVYNAFQIQWIVNGIPIPNATDSVYIAQVPGTYSVAVTDSNGCVAESTGIPVVTGINDLKSEDDIMLRPNPLGTGSLELIVGRGLIGSKVEIFDNNGRLIYNTEIGNPKSEIKLEIQAGIYLLRVISEKKFATMKLIKL